MGFLSIKFAVTNNSAGAWNDVSIQRAIRRCHRLCWEIVNVAAGTVLHMFRESAFHHYDWPVVVTWCDVIWYCRARGAHMDSNWDRELWDQPAPEQHQGRPGLQLRGRNGATPDLWELRKWLVTWAPGGCQEQTYCCCCKCCYLWFLSWFNVVMDMINWK